MRATVAGLASVLLIGCQRDSPPSLPLRTHAGRAPNVLLITVDTLRADHLGTYGYAQPTSPTIDALAARGIRCEFAVTSAPETAPGTASLLTGLQQHHTGVLSNLDKLPPSVLTLAEQLTGAGYVTAAFVGNGLVGAEQGFDQGFAHFDGFFAGPWPAGSTQHDGAGVDRALAWLETNRTTPWFVWIHLFDPHGPYRPQDMRWSEPLRMQYAALAPRRHVKPGKNNVGLGVIPRYQQLPGLFDLGEYVRRYDGEIRETDAAVGRLFDGLERQGATPDTLVVVSADHGESLTEHDEFLQHGWFLYDTTVRIPLIFAWPGVLPAGRTIREQVRGIDLVPTIEELVGVARPADATLDGVSIAASLLGHAAPVAVPAYAIGPRANRPFAVREDGWKLVYTPAGERYELYDTTADPGEEHDLAAREPARVAALSAKLAVFRRQYEDAIAAATRATAAALPPGATPAPVDANMQQRLRELGYVD